LTVVKQSQATHSGGYSLVTGTNGDHLG
jgi:hypothetical protein